MNDESLWALVGVHFWRCTSGYNKHWIYKIPWERDAYLAELDIRGKVFRVLFSGEDFHFYAYECIGDPNDLIPENWVTDWDEDFSEKERKTWR